MVRKRKEGVRVSGTLLEVFLLNPVLLLVVRHSTSHYWAKNTMSSGKNAIIINSQLLFD